jgi:hypothetical protein
MELSSWIPWVHVEDLTPLEIALYTFLALFALGVLVCLVRIVCRRRLQLNAIRKKDKYAVLLNAPLLSDFDIERSNMMEEFQVRDDLESEYYEGTMNLLVRAEVAKELYHNRDSESEDTDRRDSLEMGGIRTVSRRDTKTLCMQTGEQMEETLLQKLKNLAMKGALRLTPSNTKLAVRVQFSPHYRPFMWRYMLESMHSTLERRRRRSEPTKLRSLPPAMINLIDLDAPRNRLCPEQKRDDLKDLLKAWLLMMPEGSEYRQGADTLAAICLEVFPDDAAVVGSSAMLHITRNFIPHYFNANMDGTNKFLEQRMELFSSLLRFWDPAVSCYLKLMEISPSMFAVPWFVTLFGDLWPIEKVIYIWDALFVLGPDFLVFIAISILCHGTNRAKLLRSSFSNAMLFFSRLNRGEEQLNLRLCIFKAISMFSQTPQSLLHYTSETTTDIAHQQIRQRGASPPRYCPGSTEREWSSTPFSEIEDHNALVLVVSWADIFELDEGSRVLIDLRRCTEDEHAWLTKRYNNGEKVIHLPSVLENQDSSEKAVLLLSKLKPYIGRYIFLCIWNTDDCSAIVEMLARAGIPRVCSFLLNRQMSIAASPLLC